MEVNFSSLGQRAEEIKMEAISRNDSEMAYTKGDKTWGGTKSQQQVEG